jgi:U6 snRNA-associated Sm-like protein LSm4
MLVELKNGETLNGHLVTCDTWMNLTLKEVVQTSPVRCFFPSPASFSRKCLETRTGNAREKGKLIRVWQDGDKFYRLPEVYVKGNNVRAT